MMGPLDWCVYNNKNVRPKEPNQAAAEIEDAEKPVSGTSGAACSPGMSNMRRGQQHPADQLVRAAACRALGQQRRDAPRVAGRNQEDVSKRTPPCTPSRN